MPRPIYDAFRNTTFAIMRPSVTASIPTEPSASGTSVPDCVVQADSGAYIIGMSPHVHLHDGALTIVPLDLNVRMEKEKLRPTTSLVAATSLHDSTSHLSGSMEIIHSDTVDSNDESEAKVDLISLQASVGAWLEDTEKEDLDPLPVDVNDTDPFIPGVIGGMSMNDILMVKGHIDPSVYVRFFNLNLYS